MWIIVQFELINKSRPGKPQSKKSRPGKPSPTTHELRRLSKDVCRSRFFSQCVKVDSPLWKPTPLGKESFNRFLFSRAVQYPVSTLYNMHPGVLRNIPGSKLEAFLNWQVRKDCQNYKGKPPKRQIVWSTPSPEFDWDAENAAIEKTLERTYYASSLSSMMASSASSMSKTSLYNSPKVVNLQTKKQHLSIRRPRSQKKQISHKLLTQISSFLVSPVERTFGRAFLRALLRTSTLLQNLLIPIGLIPIFILIAPLAGRKKKVSWTAWLWNTKQKDRK